MVAAVRGRQHSDVDQGDVDQGGADTPCLLPRVKMPAKTEFVDSSKDARVTGAFLAGPALLVVIVSSLVVRAWIWRCTAAGLMPL